MGHYLSPSGKTRVPECIVYIDCTITETADDEGSSIKLDEWFMCGVSYDPVSADVLREHRASGRNTRDFAQEIQQFCSEHKETWIISKEISVTAHVTRLVPTLALDGWEMAFCSVTDKGTLVSMTKDKRHICICDVWSWVRDDLENVPKERSEALSSPKAVTSSVGDRTNDDRTDIAVCRQALETIMRWWLSEQLGIFKVTGAASGWQAMRSKLTPKALVVGRTKEQAAMERRAIYSGHKEVYRIGAVKSENIADYDFVNAYLSALAHFSMPTCLITRQETIDWLEKCEAWFCYGYVADVIVTTNTPGPPCRIGHTICTPVGRFKTTLTSPEIRYWRSCGAEIVETTKQWYRLGSGLMSWANYLLDQLDKPREELPDVVRKMVKSWGRSTIGKTASLHSVEISRRPALTANWTVEDGVNLTTWREQQIMTWQGEEVTTERSAEPPDGCPIILAWVEGIVRVALHEAMSTRVPASIILANTDGWLETSADTCKAGDVFDGPWPFVVATKKTYHEVYVFGANHVLSNADRRLSGIPIAAKLTRDGIYSWQEWPSLSWQLTHSDSGIYRRPRRSARIDGPYVMRWVCQSGQTVPLSVDMDSEGNNVILDWEHTTHRRDADILADTQNPQLLNLLPTGDVSPVILQPNEPEIGRTVRTWVR